MQSLVWLDHALKQGFRVLLVAHAILMALSWCGSMNWKLLRLILAAVALSMDWREWMCNSEGACRAWHLTPSCTNLCMYSYCRWVHPFQQSILLLICCCSLQFESPNSYSPRCGVNIKVPGAAGTDITKVEHLDSFGLYEYANHLVDYFVARGYVRDFSIRAMPYDWRFAAGIHISIHLHDKIIIIFV